MHEFATTTQFPKGSRQQEEQLVRILLVDDDRLYRALCERFLKRDSSYNYEIIGASSATCAIKMCLRNSYDCLILDYELPDATGTELLSSLHDAIGEALPPAVILTAGGGEEAATQAVRANAADFLSKKDVSQQSLCRTVNNIVEKSRLRNDVRARSEELCTAYAELQCKNDEIKNFYHTISHEVKTPLFAVREFISLVNDEAAGPVTQQQQELLGYALESCDQISLHFNDLIDLTRLETKKLIIRTDLESLNRLISRSITGLEGIARENNVELVNRTSTDLPNLYLDANRIVQVLSNLLTNAIKYTPTGGVVYIESKVKRDDNCVEIRIVDTGCGIDESQYTRIFDRLYQINSIDDCPVSGGLGLGLSIAREIAILHDGILSVDSRLGEGSTFILQLPLSRD